MPGSPQHDLLFDAQHLIWLGGSEEEARALATDRTVLHDVMASDDDLFAADFTPPPPIDPDLTARIHQALLVVGYELESRLDDHANSQVYQARRLANDSTVAVKVVLEQPCDTSSAVQRFRQESRLLQSLRHPHLVRALAHGSLQGVNYLVLELAAGRNLRRVVEESGPLSVGRAANIVYQAADVLEYIHQQGVVHRDIKPSNFVLSTDDCIKLLDLGLARVPASDGSITILYNDRLLGTPDFMAPEQALDCHQADGRADIYALGCTLYFLLTGRPPLAGKNIVDCLLKHQHVQPPPLATYRADVPAGLAAICARMMAKAPSDRYERASEVAAALSPWAKD